MEHTALPPGRYCQHCTERPAMTLTNKTQNDVYGLSSESSERSGDVGGSAHRQGVWRLCEPGSHEEQSIFLRHWARSNKFHLASCTEDSCVGSTVTTCADGPGSARKVAVLRKGHRHPCRGAEADPNGATDAEDHRALLLYSRERLTFQRWHTARSPCSTKFGRHCWRRRRSSFTERWTSRDDATPGSHARLHVPRGDEHRRSLVERHRCPENIHSAWRRESLHRWKPRDILSFFFGLGGKQVPYHAHESERYTLARTRATDT